MYEEIESLTEKHKTVSPHIETVNEFFRMQNIVDKIDQNPRFGQVQQKAFQLQGLRGQALKLVQRNSNTPQKTYMKPSLFARRGQSFHAPQLFQQQFLNQGRDEANKTIISHLPEKTSLAAPQNDPNQVRHPSLIRGQAPTTRKRTQPLSKQDFLTDNYTNMFRQEYKSNKLTEEQARLIQHLISNPVVSLKRPDLTKSKIITNFSDNSQPEVRLRHEIFRETYSASGNPGLKPDASELKEEKIVKEKRIQSPTAEELIRNEQCLSQASKQIKENFKSVFIKTPKLQRETPGILRSRMPPLVYKNIYSPPRQFESTFVSSRPSTTADSAHLSILGAFDPIQLASFRQQQRMQVHDFNFSSALQQMKDDLSHKVELSSRQKSRSVVQREIKQPAITARGLDNVAQSIKNRHAAGAKGRSKLEDAKERVVKQTLKTLYEYCKTQRQLRELELQRIEAMKEKAFARFSNKDNLSYFELKRQMRDQKQLFLSGKPLLGGFFSDKSGYLRAETAFKTQNTDMLVSIEHKAKMTQDMELFANRNSLLELAQKCKAQDPTFAEWLEELCTNSTESDLLLYFQALFQGVYEREQEQIQIKSDMVQAAFNLRLNQMRPSELQSPRDQIQIMGQESKMKVQSGNKVAPSVEERLVDLIGKQSLQEMYNVAMSEKLFQRPFICQKKTEVDTLQKQWGRRSKDRDHTVSPPLDVEQVNKDITDLFQKRINFLKFYKEIKERPNEPFNLTVKASGEVTQPSFLNIFEHQLCLSEYRIGDGEAQALSNYINKVAVDQERRERQNSKSDVIELENHVIRMLRIDNCGLTDQNLSLLLDGVMHQRHLVELDLLNSVLGKQSVDVLCQMLNQEDSGVYLQTFRLVNIQGFTLTLKQQLLKAIKLNASLIKLKLSYVDLGEPSLVKLLSEIIQSCRYLDELDLTWCSLNTKALTQITETLIHFSNKLYSLNLSYNSVRQLSQGMEVTKKHLSQQQEIEGLTQLICTYLSETTALNHIDLSGTGLPRDSVLSICETLSSQQSLLSVHLDELQISTVSEYALQVLDLLGMENTPYHDEKVEQPTSANIKVKNNLSENPMFLVKSQTQRHVKNKVSEHKFGFSRNKQLETVPQDQFLLTRKPMFTELCFSDHNDFDLLMSQHWQLPRGECYICEKHKYVFIYFDPTSASSVLTRVTDANKIKALRDSLKTLEFNHEDPVIFGSVTHSWARKLRMMDARAFSLLSVADREEFKWDRQKMSQFKSDLISSLKDSSFEGIQRNRLAGWNHILQAKLCKNSETECLTVNLPTDLDTNRNFNNAGHRSFVYAELLPAGLHEFVIYDQESDSFWNYDFFLDLRKNKIVFGGLNSNKKQLQKVLCNVWRSWKQDTAEDLRLIYSNDAFRLNPEVQEEKFFQPELILGLSSEECIGQLHDHLEEQYPIIMKVFNLISCQSSMYPMVNLQDTIKYFEPYLQLFQDELTDPQSAKVIFVTQMEKTWRASYKTKTARGLFKAFNRSEWLNFFLQLIKLRFRNILTPETDIYQICDMITEFIKEVFMQTYLSCQVQQERHHIQSSQVLNKLLLENKTLLTTLYQMFMEKGKFNRESAKKLITLVLEPIYKDDMKEYQLAMKQYENAKKAQQQIEEGFDQPIIEEPQAPPTLEYMTNGFFTSSKMTVINEQKTSDRYFVLTYVEFLEMYCRVAIYFSHKTSKVEEDGQSNEKPVYECVSELLQKCQSIVDKLKPNSKRL